ncbi:Hypothetical predicted protein [Cloeon dipterum]|uniref:Caspase family p10 domain-containing protein n=1 Tax=Cloeon dipterum TaxID=197152 RepID=A0A8S1CWG1_9INSE|nr:Hypothetical predicted protein [Cloeon dipterum]
MPEKSPVKLGYFKNKNGTKEILTSVFVLVVHYAFKNLKNDIREGNEEDVDRLRQTFEEKRNCSFREWASPRKHDLFDLISSEEELLRLFDASSPPQLFIMYILSHGSEGGIIFTEHPNSTFKREEIYARLLQLKNFGGCLKFINFGPCRSAEVEDGSLNYSNNSLEDVKKATQVSFVPNYDQNLAIFSSTVETQYANREDRGKRKGSWFVQSTCDVFDELERETCFADILTIVHHQIHENSKTFLHNFQTPEFHLYPHRQLVIQPCPSSTKNDSHGRYRVTAQRHLKHFFSWKRKSASLPRRRAMIFFTHESKQVQKLNSALTYYLQFETSLRNIAKENPDFLSKVKLKKDIPDCLMIVFFARIAVDDEGKINVIMPKGKTLTIAEIVSKFVKEETMIGKPKIFLFLIQPTHSNTKIDCMHTKAINAYHLSNWLTFVSCDEGTSDKLIETLESYELRSGRSLQEMFSRVLMAANGKALMVSTMQFSLDFPELPRHFVVPTFQLDNENKNYDELLINILGSRETWLLTAAVGMGKSTVMLQLAHCLRESLHNKRQVILVQLSRFHHFFATKGQSCSLVSLLATVTSENVSVTCRKLGATALHHAAANKEHGVGLISFFFQRGLRTDARDRDGETPIHYAVWAGNFQHAKELIQFSDHAWNLLQFFVVENNLELAKRVHQDDRSLMNEVGESTIFHLAASHADVAMCSWLVEEGVDATSECRNLKYTALHYASKNKSFGKEIVHFLVDSLGLDVNKRSVNDETPLHCALSETNIEVAEELLDLNAESLRVKIGENTLIHYCMRWNKLTSAKFIHARDVGMVKELGKNRKSSLHVAAQYADLETNKWLVELAGVDPHVECGTKDKGTALHYVGFNKIHGVQLVDFYVSKGLKVDGNTRINPLHFALSKGNVNVAEKLLQLGADLRVKLKDFNLLQYSVIKNRFESAQFVHSKNSEMIKEDGRQGMNVLRLAAKHADLRMCKWLVEQCNECNNNVLAPDYFSVLQSAKLNESHSEEIMQYFTDLILLNTY